MIRALREYIIELKREILEAALGQLKKNLDFDSTAIDHLHLALYSFQDAVNIVLRKHNIKPHWMFALDNLVKSAVQAGITVLSPELGANLAGQRENGEEGDEDEEEEDDVSSSGVSTVNSHKPSRLGERGDRGVASGVLVPGGFKCSEELNALRVENSRLTQSLIESQRQLQSFLKVAVEEQNVNVEFIRTFLVQRPQFERGISQGYFSDRGNANNNNYNSDVQIKVDDLGIGSSPVEMEMASPDSIDGSGGDSAAAAATSNASNTNNNNNQRRFPVTAARSPTRSRRLMIHAAQNNCEMMSRCDTRLNEWLVARSVDTVSRNMIHMQDFSYEDFLYELAKDDLLRIGLKTGVEVRLWRAVRDHRKTYPNYTAEQQQQQQYSNNNGGVSTNEILDELNRNEINRNAHGLTVVVPQQQQHGRSRHGNGSVPEIHVQPGSNCNSFDSAATTSSEDYESCNGGHATGDERMDL